jgi:RES domain-containing protein
MLTFISGEFVKIAFASDVKILLAQGDARRPAARFNRMGQDALYLSPDEASARVAIGEYIRADDPPRVLAHFQVTSCHLVDMRQAAAADVYELARQPWQQPFKRGEAPSSWLAADRLREAGHVGLIDPSRQRPGLWHITLFNWNQHHGPSVRISGPPTPIQMSSFI